MTDRILLSLSLFVVWATLLGYSLDAFFKNIIVW
jgi:hypothetical protein